MCNKVDDCGDNSDEEECGEHPRVPSGHGIAGISWNFRGGVPERESQRLFINSLLQSWNIREFLKNV